MVDPVRNSPQSDWEMTRPRVEGEEALRDYQALRARVEALEQLSRDEPWWRNPRTVTVVAGLLAALVPLTTAVDGYFKGRTNLALAHEQQRHAMRMDYMKTALDPQAPEMQRQSRLRLLVAILGEDDPVRSWAQGELGIVTENVKELQKTLAKTANELAQVQATEQQVNSTVSGLEKQLSQQTQGAQDVPARRPEALVRELEKARADLQSVKRRKEQLASQAAQTQQRLGDTKQAPLTRE